MALDTTIICLLGDFIILASLLNTKLNISHYTNKFEGLLEARYDNLTMRGAELLLIVGNFAEIKSY